MKKALSIIACVLTLSFAVTSCDWFDLDNMESWDAAVEGQILDIETNEPIQFEQGSTINVVEQGWQSQANQAWAVKNNGSFKNTLVFAGSYVMNTLSNNFMADPQSFELKKGNNTVNFKAKPYVRIVNPTVTMEGDKIKVTCSVKSSIAAVNNVGEVRVCVAPDRFVRQSNNNVSNDPGSFVTDIAPDGSQQLTLYVDTKLAANAYEFQYNRPHFIRIAAVGAHYVIKEAWDEDLGPDMSQFPWDLLDWNDFHNYNDLLAITPHLIVHHDAEYASDGTINTGMAYNYSPVYKLENGAITEVTDW